MHPDTAHSSPKGSGSRCPVCPQRIRFLSRREGTAPPLFFLLAQSKHAVSIGLVFSDRFGFQAWFSSDEDGWMGLSVVKEKLETKILF